MRLPIQSQSIRRSVFTTITYEHSRIIPSELLVANEFEEENIQRTIIGYVRNVISKSCFPCCFCCEGPGTCCSQCKAKNFTANPSW